MWKFSHPQISSSEIQLNDLQKIFPTKTFVNILNIGT